VWPDAAVALVQVSTEERKGRRGSHGSSDAAEALDQAARLLGLGEDESDGADNEAARAEWVNGRGVHENPNGE